VRTQRYERTSGGDADAVAKRVPFFAPKSPKKPALKHASIPEEGEDGDGDGGDGGGDDDHDGDDDDAGDSSGGGGGGLRGFLKAPPMKKGMAIVAAERSSEEAPDRMVRSTQGK